MKREVLGCARAFISHSLGYVSAKKIAKLEHICQRYHKNKDDVFMSDSVFLMNRDVHCVPKKTGKPS